MIDFKKIPPDLYRSVEPEAGTVLPPLKGRFAAQRPCEDFEPDWGYLLSGAASVEAVVAGLRCGMNDVPERIYERVLQTYCPNAWKLLSNAGFSYRDFYTGDITLGLGSAVAALANIELGGYAVFYVMDIPGTLAEIIAALGSIPTFE